MILTWLTATIVGSAGFLLLALVGFLVAERRRLRTAGASRPGTIMWKRLAGPVLRIAGSRHGDGTRVDLVGATVWLEWDQRWGPHGASMGRVVRQTGADGGSRLLIETATVQALPTGPATAIWFVAESTRRLSMHHLAVVRGTLRNHDHAEVAAAQRNRLAAEIVVISASEPR
ncbi:MAG TPA: hypothetical protein VJ813_02915 [Vicinamibacterales bacterium]|nr:hypothetical protein [Vicinamibacterales bacterium]